MSESAAARVGATAHANVSQFVVGLPVSCDSRAYYPSIPPGHGTNSFVSFQTLVITSRSPTVAAVPTSPSPQPGPDGYQVPP